MKNMFSLAGGISLALVSACQAGGVDSDTGVSPAGEVYTIEQWMTCPADIRLTVQPMGPILEVTLCTLETGCADPLYWITTEGLTVDCAGGGDLYLVWLWE